MLNFKTTFNHTAHKALWSQLEAHPEQSKLQALYAINIPEKEWPIASCFACECGCHNCPLDWPQGEKCYNENSLYNKWCLCKWLNVRSLLARQIADLPINPNFKGKVI